MKTIPHFRAQQERRIYLKPHSCQDDFLTKNSRNSQASGEEYHLESYFARGIELGWEGSGEGKDKGGGAKTILLNDLF